MVNFNLQDGYSVVTQPRMSSSYHLHNQDDDDANEDRKASLLLDSFNLIQEHQMSSELATATSVLLVHEVQFKHGGNYTCAPSNTRPTNINVHVLKGEYKYVRIVSIMLPK
jgi:hypothetical protein